jgi:hypothetical protein
VRSRMLVALLCGFAAIVGCGDGKMPPSAPTPTVVALALSPATDLLKIKSTEKFAATATLTDGTPRSVLANWGSDAPGIAAAAGDGTVTGVGSGEVTIFAEYEGLRATRRLRVVPEYAGSWIGTYRTTACVETGDWVFDSCGGIDRARSFTLSLALLQTGATVSGGIRIYSDIPSVQLSGSVATNGALDLSGGVAYSLPNCTQSCFFQIVDWVVVSSDNLQFSGEFTIRVSSPALQGYRAWTSEITGTRTASAPPVLPPPVPDGG